MQGQVKIVAANFKTNHTRHSTAAYPQVLGRHIAEHGLQSELYLFPPFTALDRYPLPSGVAMGVQNAYPVANGSFTGEIGTEQLDEFGIRTLLIGHSERRHILGETQAQIAAKFAFFQERGYKIIYCAGETIDVRRQGIDAVMHYVWGQFEGIDTSYDNFYIAYEPVWAIGTGVTAQISDIAETHARIRERYPQPLLYGGSVKVENAEAIYRTPHVDGVLVGTTSWKAEAYCELVRIADKVKESGC